jgi:hypothetical protein
VSHDWKRAAKRFRDRLMMAMSRNRSYLMQEREIRAENERLHTDLADAKLLLARALGLLEEPGHPAGWMREAKAFFLRTAAPSSEEVEKSK